MKILFHENFLNKRGTSIALFDYAYFNQKILGNESLIISNNTKPNDNEVVKKFKRHFNVLGYNNFNEIENIINEHKIDVFYIIKSGENDGMLVPNVKNVVHSVFCSDVSQIHGDVYATVSEWLSSTTNFKIPFVPHMINYVKNSDDLRHELNIPKENIVIGRHGGLDTFNIRFVYNSIEEILNKRTDINFLFMNTNKFIDHPRAMFLDGTSDMDYKSKFINTCDAMIHARDNGESFGLSVLEFATKNKHIITYGLSPEKSHIFYLKNNCSIYNNKVDLDNIFLFITKNNPYDTYYLNDIFSPNNIMNKFKEVFL